METDSLTERTPLIDHSNTSDSLPFILELERGIYSDVDYPAVHTIIERKVEAYATSPSTALVLKLLLCLRYLSGAYFELGKDDWIDSRSAEQHAIEMAVRVWDELQRLAWSQAAFDEALWMGFLLRSGKEERISLIQTILADRAGVPHGIQLDDRVAVSLLRIWKKGMPPSVYTDRGSSFIVRIEGFATPRVLHLVDLVFYLAFIIILASCIIRPYPYYPIGPPRPDLHFYYIVIYAASRILKDPWPSASHATFALTMAAFLSALPYMPKSRDNSYNVLLFCFFAHFVHLLLPISPSLPLLGPHSTSFTVSSILHNLFVVVLAPALTLFFPIIFVLIIILAASLQDIWIWTSDLKAFDLFLFTLWSSGLLFTCLASYMTLSSASLPNANSHHPAVPVTWNSYGSNVGVSLRRHFCRQVITYSNPYPFPAPLSLVRSSFVLFSCSIMILFGQQQLVSQTKLAVEQTLWRILVLPLTLIFGVLWLWK